MPIRKEIACITTIYCILITIKLNTFKPNFVIIQPQTHFLGKKIEHMKHKNNHVKHQQRGTTATSQKYSSKVNGVDQDQL